MRLLAVACRALTLLILLVFGLGIFLGPGCGLLRIFGFGLERLFFKRGLFQGVLGLLLVDASLQVDVDVLAGLAPADGRVALFSILETFAVRFQAFTIFADAAHPHHPVLAGHHLVLDLDAGLAAVPL